MTEMSPEAEVIRSADAAASKARVLTEHIGNVSFRAHG